MLVRALRELHCVDLTEPGGWGAEVRETIVCYFPQPFSLNSALLGHNNTVNFTPNCYSFPSKISKQRRRDKGCMMDFEKPISYDSERVREKFEQGKVKQSLKPSH